MKPRSADLKKALRPADSVSQLLRHAHRAFMRTMEQRLAKHGIVISTWFLLRALWEEDGLTQGELGNRIGIVGPTAVAAIKRLVQDGLAVRAPDPSDKRKVKIFLTPKARQLRAALLSDAAEVVDQASAGISQKDLTHLKRTLRKLVLNLERFVPEAFLSEVRILVEEAKRGKRYTSRVRK